MLHFVTKGNIMTQMRFELNEQTAQVLDVIKGKHGLKNRNDALAQLVKTHADDYIEPKINEKVLHELDRTYNETVKSGKVKMTREQLRKHLGFK